MAEYIEKQLVLSKSQQDYLEGRYDYDDFVLVSDIESIPPADVRPVVTCAECDWHVDCGYHFCNKWCQPCPDNADFYCAYGERSTAVPT